MGRSALVLLVLCATAAAQELKRYEDENKVFSVDLPVAWEVETGKGDDKDWPLKLKIKVPGVKGFVFIDLFSLDGVRLTARAQARYERPLQTKRFEANKSELKLEPIPHLRVDYDSKNGNACVAVWAYKRKLCRGLVLLLKCLRTEWPDVKDPFLKAAQGMWSTLGRYPEIPSGYERSEHAGFVFLSAPGFKRNARKRIQKICGETQKWFVKLHGPIERPPSEPPLVFLHKMKREAGRLNEYAAKAKSGHMAHYEARAIYAVPVHGTRSTGHCVLVTQIHRLLFAERYGGVYPEWVQAGDAELFVERVRTGRKMPFVTRAWKRGFRGVLLRLDQLESIHRETDWEAYVHHGMAYTLLFRLGPPKYRKAFGGFLEALRAHGDWDQALQDHLFVLDQSEVIGDANKFLDRKVKAVEARR